MRERDQDEPRAGRPPARPFERRQPREEADAVESEPYRGPDRRAEEQRPSQTRKWRESLEKWRQPLIGLAMAGAAAPLVDQQVSPESTASRQPSGSKDVAEPRAPGEEVGDRWREVEENRHRELTVAGAVSRYGITEELASDIYDIAVEEKIEPELAYGLVNTESTFRQQVTSWAGARGLTQVMPSTARWIMGRNVDLFDPQENLRTGFRYLRKLIDDYGGDIRKALLAYNRGPGTVNRILDRGGNPDNGYADKVLDG
ncbi:MAG: lytic transglycosylase domain-containing protein [Longimicrobiales bacterium]